MLWRFEILSLDSKEREKQLVTLLQSNWILGIFRARDDIVQCFSI